ELTVTLRAAANPYPTLPGYHFGLVQEDVKPARADLIPPSSTAFRRPPAVRPSSTAGPATNIC
ncbi:hypothetical protein, partial [Azospirillum sp. B506]|uniref:hypothetical protein n=1 Tax=Azospirillum sp. B506 TaxID=137721 RepID=UPI001902BC9C